MFLVVYFFYIRVDLLMLVFYGRRENFFRVEKSIYNLILMILIEFEYKYIDGGWVFLFLF